MRIARILTRLNLGGPARQALAADPRLGARGHEVRILTGLPEPGEGDLFDEFRARGLAVVRIPTLGRGIRLARDLAARRAIGRELVRFRPDVVHTHASKAGLLGRRAVGKLSGAERTARVHTFHGHVLEGYFPRIVSQRLIALERRLARATDRIVAVSHATADDLVRLEVCDEEKLVVVPPGVELEELLQIDRGGPPSVTPDSWRARIGASADDVLVGVVGRLAAVKQPERAVEVFARLAAAHPELRLLFVGDGEEREALERRIAALPVGAASRVHLLGAVREMAPLFAALDLLLLTSRHEGLPVAIVEAAAAGLAAVATPVGGVREVIVHERTGWLGAETTDLARGVAWFLEDRGRRVELGQRARLRVEKRHGAEALVDRLESLYRAVLEERRGEGTA